MTLTKDLIARLIDISAVKAESNREEVEIIVDAAKTHNFICVFTLPAFTAHAKKLLANHPGILLGGTVGFPSGASSTSVKIFEAEELITQGCDELDMVINVGKLKSGMYRDVAADIRGVINAAESIPVKVILEVSLLSNEEIETGAKLIRDNGAKFVKTGTGWSGPTEFNHIETIKKAVGDTIAMKVAGGVRDLDTLLTFMDMGVVRFGIGYRSAIHIINTVEEKSGVRQ